jgi:hypothetical protein
LFWKERRSGGSICPPKGCSIQPEVAFSQQATFLAKMLGQNSFPTYLFAPQIPLNASISELWFEVDEKDGAGPTVVDNGGSKYEIKQDTVLFDPRRTSVIFDDDKVEFAIVVGVRGLSVMVVVCATDLRLFCLLGS